jgi:uncharacterized protein (TIGR04222 family)
MNWLLNNPISEMPGPLFLMLYAGLMALIFGESFFKNRRADRSRELGPMPIPTKPDPYEIAYLRGGHNEVTRLVVLDLMSRGYLRVDERTGAITRKAETRIGQDPTHPEVDRLSPMEATAFLYFATSRKPEVLFQAGGLASKLKDGLEPLAESLREQHLLPGPERYEAAGRTWQGGALMILAFGGFKMAIALAKGRYNIGFLLAFAVFGLVLLSFCCLVPRVTRRGKDYLLRLREAFEGLRWRASEAQILGSLDPGMVLVPAVFGVAALAGTPYDGVPALFKSAAKPNGGCGGGCGSAGGGCGDGGGGGGCGGGGCGGGCGGCGG